MLLFLIMIVGIGFCIWYFFIRQTKIVCNDGDKPCLIGRCTNNKCVKQCDASHPCKQNYQCLDKRCVDNKPPVPNGKYCGTVGVLNMKLDGEMNFNTDGKVDFSTSDAISITCIAEPFTMDGSLIMITDIGTPGDCVHDALVNNNVSVESVTYSKETNQIVLKASIKIQLFTFPVSMTLTSCV